MNRRGFLEAMLSMAAAPAIVKASNIMKIWTPPTDIITDPFDFIGDEYTATGWVSQEYPKWVHVAIVKSGQTIKKYIDGEQVDDHPLIPKFIDYAIPFAKDIQQERIIDE